ncbi:hypothetical protein MTBSS4_900002 [Magnetospirillum sp. SS-4]|nr:hypothetical protein MTBSS4_900002 [Magnetospirillum sp. SS-4]
MVVVEAGGGDYLAGQCAALGLRLSDHPVAGNVCFNELGKPILAIS